jgi:hypothetical protein
MSIKTCKGILTPRLISSIKELLTDLPFKIAVDNKEHVGKMLDTNIKLQGLSRVSNHPPIGPTESRLNDFGFFITEKICEKVNLNYSKIRRFMWNIYRAGEEGIFHNDGEEEGLYTILYSLNSSDGYLQINDAKFYDVEDEAKVFPSKLLHKGVGPEKDRLRINLNIVLEGCKEK